MITEQEAKEHIAVMHTYLTVSDIAEELELTVQHVHYLCRQLGVKPIKVRQRNINFILENHTRMSGARIAKMLGLEENVLAITYGKELGIHFLSEEPKVPVVEKPKEQSLDSPGAILSNYQRSDLVHYHEPKVDQKDVDEMIQGLLRLGKKSNL